MDAPLDLYRASREELIGIVLRQQEQLAEQKRRLAWQERELAQQRAAIVQLQERVGTLLALLDPPDGDDPPTHPTTMPGLKPAAVSPRPAPAALRKRRGGGLWPVSDDAHGAAGACPRPVSPLRDRTDRGHGAPSAGSD
ncbi:MAG: hypothetical protein U0031_10300 [Thermomicrobiales bacterium]